MLAIETVVLNSPNLREGRVEEFSSTGQVLTHGLVDTNIHQAIFNLVLGLKLLVSSGTIFISLNLVLCLEASMKAEQTYVSCVRW